MAEDNYHVRVVRSRLTKNLADIHDGLFNEISVALSEYITTGSDGGMGRFNTLLTLRPHPLKYFPDWMPIPAHDTMLKVIARSSNRVFVGLPLCITLLLPLHMKSPDKFFTQGRSPAYTDLSIKFTTQLASAALLMSAMPLGLKRSVSITGL